MSWSRGARRLASVVSAALVAGLLVATTPSTASAVDTPSALAATDGSARILSWGRVPGATGYDVQVARTSSFSPTLVSVSTVNDTYVPTGQLPVGEVWWRVRAKAGTTIGSWATSTFSTTTRAAPVPVGPNVDEPFTPPTAPRFTWEPVAGATSYTVQTSPDIAFTDPKLVATNTQKTTAAYLTSYPPTGYYYWRVQAELSSGYATAWSTPRRYKIKGLPAPELVTPVNRLSPPVTDVVLDWTPVPGAKTYDLQVSLDDDFTDNIVLLLSGVTSTQHTPAETLDNDDYFWRVRAVDASNRAGEWSQAVSGEPWKFTRAWPDQPTPVHPAGPLVPGRPFYYQFEPIERASRYVIHVQKGSIVDWCTVSTVHTTLAPNDRDECQPDTPGTYLWRVEGLDDDGDASTAWRSQAPVEFQYSAPATPPGPFVANVENQRASLTGSAAFKPGTAASDPDTSCQGVPANPCEDLRQTPVLTWDPVPGAVNYRVTLADDALLTNLVKGYEDMPVDQPMWTPPLTKTLSDNQAGSAYFWVVRPCTTTSITSCVDMPRQASHWFAKKTVAPRLAGPADLPSGVDPRPFSLADDVTLTWGTELAATRDASPAALGSSGLSTPGTMEAKNYIVQTALDRGFTVGVETNKVDQTAFTAPTSTYPEGTTYWRVRAIDGGNTPTDWSGVRSFYKSSPVPVPITPVNGQPLGQNYTLTWEPLAFAASYDVEVYAGPDRVADENSKYSSWTPSTPFPASADGYRWRVRRVDAKGRQGEWSAFQAFTFGGFPVSQEAPAPLAVVPATGARFSWLSDSRATSYRFERRKPGTTDVAETVTTRATAWAPTTTLTPGTAQWRVVALDAAGKSLGASPWRDFKVTGSGSTVERKSTTKIKLSAKRTTVKKRVTVTVKISVSGVRSPGGSVSVYVGKKRIKVLKLKTGTSVKVKLPRLKSGTKTIRAVYAGGPEILGSSAKTKLKVTKR